MAEEKQAPTPLNFTPGPWHVEDKDYDRFGQIVWIEAEHGPYICELVRDGQFREHANARLIAKSPAMFDLLQMVAKGDPAMAGHVAILANELIDEIKDGA